VYVIIKYIFKEKNSSDDLNFDTCKQYRNLQLKKYIMAMTALLT